MITKTTEIPHVTITPSGNPVAAYTLKSDEGYYIHLTKRNPNDYYKTCVMLNAGYDWSSIEIVAEQDLPADAKVV